MTHLTDLSIVLRSLTSRLFSTTITVATVAVAVALMLVLLTMREAGRRAFDRGSGDMHLYLSADSSPLVSVLNGVFYANPPARAIPYARYQSLRATLPVDAPEGSGLEPGYAIPTQIGDSYRGLPVVATTPEFFTRFKPDERAGLTFAQGRAFAKEFELVVGARAARLTGLKLGDKVALTHGAPKPGEEAHVHEEYKYEVVGILAPTGTPHDRALFSDLNSTWILHAHDRRERAETHEHAGDEAPLTVADLTDADRLITGIMLRLATRPGAAAPSSLPQVFSRLRTDATLTVASPSDQIRRLFEIVGAIDQLFIAMAAVVMLSSGIAIMLALYNSMELRRRQIAVLRVLGASRGRIFGLVLTESALLGLMGGAAGIAVAFLGARVAADVLRRSVGLVIDPTLDPRASVVIAAAAVLLAALAGIVPAVMAYRTSVAKNLRPIG